MKSSLFGKISPILRQSLDGIGDWSIPRLTVEIWVYGNERDRRDIDIRLDGFRRHQHAAQDTWFKF